MVFVKRTLGIKTEEPKKTPARHSADAKLGKGGKKGKGGGKSGGHKSKGGGKGGRRAAAEDISVTASAPNGMVRATATHSALPRRAPSLFRCTADLWRTVCGAGADQGREPRRLLRVRRRDRPHTDALRALPRHLPRGTRAGKA